MSERAKKILLIAGLVIATLALAYLLYYFFIKTSPLGQLPTGQPAGGPEAPTGALPPAGERAATTGPSGVAPGAGQLPTAGAVPGVQPSYYQPQAMTKIAGSIANFSSTGVSGNLRYYNAADGKFYRLGADNTTKSLSDQAFYNVQKITWAKSNDKAILEYPDGSKIVYDFESQKQATLPKHWNEFSFSADGEEIAAKSIGLSPENRWLVTVNSDGTGTTLVEPMGENANKVIVNWSPSRQTVAFSMTGRSLGTYRKEILFVGLHGENFKSFVAEGLGFQPQWSPTGQKLLYSVYSDRSDLKPELWVVDSYGQQIGNNRTNLSLNTWAEKCAFGSDETLYCAVPKELPQGAGISPAIADSIADEVYKIDLKTGSKNKLTMDREMTVGGLTFDETNKRLILNDKSGAGIYEIKL